MAMSWRDGLVHNAKRAPLAAQGDEKAGEVTLVGLARFLSMILAMCLTISSCEAITASPALRSAGDFD